eukprot:CAMPEP_0174822482 /NCGR_PEP_ID=MMETSP1107-20130205/15969_1 /TAXON_ID=36770 /ORGANISM="Paraphysomonas vestita, Strain GFlagA" /LENGTH=30 /DNA_ID= /DNA_START= /DNA_END= /DNA_ORIENTATION=
MIEEELFQWQIMDLTQMVHNSLLHMQLNLI